MKKVTTLFLACIMAVSLVGFGGCKKQAPAPGTENAPAPATNAPAPGATNAPGGAMNAPASK